MIVQLMQGALDNVKATASTKDALTGPLMRGDIATLNLHLKAVNNNVVVNLYKAAGLATLNLTALNDHQKKQIATLLSFQ